MGSTKMQHTSLSLRIVLRIFDNVSFTMLVFSLELDLEEFLL